MTGIPASNKVNEKYIPYLSLLVVLCTLFYGFVHYPLFNFFEMGDETYYKDEVDYLAKYGAYHSLSQGASFVYTLLIFLFSKLFFTSHLFAARILTITCFLICCALLVKCFEQFPGIGYAEKYVGLTFFCIVSKQWFMRALPDIVGMSFFLAGLLIILQSKSNRHYIVAGILVFLGFACKPVAALALPGFFVFIFFRRLSKAVWRKNLLKVFLFNIGFFTCFIVYHIPGYLTFHTLMLENKMHVYVGDKREDVIPGRREVEIYYVTVPNPYKSILQLTYTEVADYQLKHPGVDLNLSLTQYITRYFGSCMSNTFEKVFITLPYYIHNGFFFSKWTSINRWVKNTDLIKIIAALLLAVIYITQWKFLKNDLLYFILPFSYAVLLALYSIGHYEDNWLLLCMPFLALPIVKFLCKHVNIYLLLVLQMVFIFLH